MDKKGNLYLGGQTDGYIGGVNLPSYHNTTGWTDFFVLKHGVDCDCTPVDAPQPDFSFIHDNKVDEKVHFYYSGSTNLDSLVFDFGNGFRASGDSQSHVYPGPGMYEACVRAYHRCGVVDYCQTVQVVVGVSPIEGGSIKIYPNPMGSLLTLEGVALGTKVEIFNVYGQPLLSLVVRRIREQFSVEGLPSGHYILRMTSEDGSRQSMKLVK